MMDMLLQHAPDVFVCCTVGGAAPLSISYASPGVTRMLGWRPEQLCSRPLLELLHPDDVLSTAAMLAPLLDGSTPCSYLMRRVRNAEEKYRWIHMQLCHEARHRQRARTR
jgi:PAS domain S-box-containing protein